MCVCILDTSTSLFCEVSDVAMRESCVHDGHTVDAERIDITVNSIKRYYGNATRRGTLAVVEHKCAHALFLSRCSCILLCNRAPALFTPSPCMRLISRNYRDQRIPRLHANGRWQRLQVIRSAFSLLNLLLKLLLPHASIALFACNPARMRDYLRSDVKIDSRDTNDDINETRFMPNVPLIASTVGDIFERRHNLIKYDKIKFFKFPNAHFCARKNA